MANAKKRATRAFRAAVIARQPIDKHGIITLCVSSLPWIYTSSWQGYRAQQITLLSYRITVSRPSGTLVPAALETLLFNSRPLARHFLRLLTSSHPNGRVESTISANSLETKGSRVLYRCSCCKNRLDRSRMQFRPVVLNLFEGREHLTVWKICGKLMTSRVEINIF